MKNNIKIIVIAGARPNFMKIAPFVQELNKHSDITNMIVHTGQHYDSAMSGTFFDELQIPKPKYNLGVGSGSHAKQTAEIMMKFEKICITEKPNLVVVVGDVNSTIACALVAKKLKIKVAHIESGLRSFDREMPEEINRVLTDNISDYLFVTEESGITNLKKEGFPSDKIFYVGNIMIDTLINNLKNIDKEKTYKNFNLKPNDYAVVTLHRPKNVDTKEKLQKCFSILNKIQKKIKIIWPIHPRTDKNIKIFNLDKEANKLKNVYFVHPLSYFEFMSYVKNCKFVLTDSGGIQEETTYLKVPCITMRESTERPSTVDVGSNTITNLDEEYILRVFKRIQNNTYKKSTIPKYWDGKTAMRIVKIIKGEINGIL